uniref:FH2 domain-containing protein n=1 Tax=Panagrellus redivivus TaxID=6233 RepID=A0A7E4VEB5_PANRE
MPSKSTNHLKAYCCISLRDASTSSAQNYAGSINAGGGDMKPPRSTASNRAAGSIPPSGRPSSSNVLLKQALANRITPLLASSSAASANSNSNSNANATSSQNSNANSNGAQNGQNQTASRNAVSTGESGSERDRRKASDAPSEMNKSVLANPAWYRDSEGRTGFKSAGATAGVRESPEIKEGKSGGASDSDGARKTADGSGGKTELLDTTSIDMTKQKTAPTTSKTPATASDTVSNPMATSEYENVEKETDSDTTTSSKMNKSTSSEDTLILAAPTSSNESNQKTVYNPTSTTSPSSIPRHSTPSSPQKQLSPTNSPKSRIPTSGSMSPLKSNISSNSLLSPSHFRHSRHGSEPEILDATSNPDDLKYRRDSTTSDNSKISHKSVTFCEQVEINEIERLQNRGNRAKRSPSEGSSGSSDSEDAVDLNEHLAPLRRAMRSAKLDRNSSEREDTPIAEDQDDRPRPYGSHPTDSQTSTDLKAAFPRPPGLTEDEWRNMVQSIYVAESSGTFGAGNLGRDARSDDQSAHSIYLEDIYGPDVYQQLQEHLPASVARAVAAERERQAGYGQDGGYGRDNVPIEYRNNQADWDRRMLGSMTRLHAEDSDTGSMRGSGQASPMMGAANLPPGHAMVRSASGYLNLPENMGPLEIVAPKQTCYDASAENSPLEARRPPGWQVGSAANSPRLSERGAVSGLAQGGSASNSPRSQHGKTDTSIGQPKDTTITPTASHIPRPLGYEPPQKAPSADPTLTGSYDSQTTTRIDSSLDTDAQTHSFYDNIGNPLPTSAQNPNLYITKLSINLKSPSTDPRNTQNQPSAPTASQFSTLESPMTVRIYENQPSPTQFAQNKLVLNVAAQPGQPIPAEEAVALNRFVQAYGPMNRGSSAGGKAPIYVDSESEEAPRDPKPSTRKPSFDSMLSTDSRESVVSAVSYKAENKGRRNFNY